MIDELLKWKMYPGKTYDLIGFRELREEVALMEQAIRHWRRGFISHDTYMKAMARHSRFHCKAVKELDSEELLTRMDALSVVRRNEAVTIHAPIVKEQIKALKENSFAGYSDFGDKLSEVKLGGDDPTIVREWALQLEVNLMANTDTENLYLGKYPFPTLD